MECLKIVAAYFSRSGLSENTGVKYSRNLLPEEKKHATFPFLLIIQTVELFDSFYPHYCDVLSPPPHKMQKLLQLLPYFENKVFIYSPPIDRSERNMLLLSSMILKDASCGILEMFLLHINSNS